MAYAATPLYKDVKLWESLFEDFHKNTVDGLSRGVRVVEEFGNHILKEFPKYDTVMQKVVKRYALTRTLFRMRAIGRKMANDRIETLRARQSYTSQVV